MCVDILNRQLLPLSISRSEHFSRNTSARASLTSIGRIRKVAEKIVAAAPNDLNDSKFINDEISDEEMAIISQKCDEKINAADKCSVAEKLSVDAKKLSIQPSPLPIQSSLLQPSSILPSPIQPSSLQPSSLQPSLIESSSIQASSFHSQDRNNVYDSEKKSRITRSKLLETVEIIAVNSKADSVVSTSTSINQKAIEVNVPQPLISVVGESLMLSVSMENLASSENVIELPHKGFSGENVTVLVLDNSLMKSGYISCVRVEDSAIFGENDERINTYGDQAAKDPPFLPT